jgi:long-subunit fatty acid transport protein
MAMAVAAAVPAQAQQQQPIRLGPPPVSFNLAPPGARSLAMGASFIGLADDATASESNPAGLVILTRPELSAHFRYSDIETQAPNTVSGRGFGSFKDQVGSPSFFSFVYPHKSMAVSVYYQRVADFRSHSFFDGVIPGAGLPNYDQVETRFMVENTGLSAAFKVGSKISVGGSARLTRLGLDGVQSTTFPDSEDGLLFRARSSPDLSKSNFTWNAGVLLTPTSKVSVGAVYKKGTRYRFTTDIVQEAILADGRTVNLDRDSLAVPLRLPDAFGAGVAFRATESWAGRVGGAQIKYGQADNGPNVLNLYQQAGQGGREPLDDSVELHVGTEYTWAAGSDWVFAVRGGYYSDPDHDGLAALDSKQDHVTFGGGFVAKNKVQIDIAANLAQRVKEGLLSLVVRF